MKRPILWGTLFLLCGIYMRLGISIEICLASFVCMVAILSYFVITMQSVKPVVLLCVAVVGFFAADNAQLRQRPLFSEGTQVQGKAVIREVGQTAAGNQKLTLVGSIGTVEEGETYFEKKKLYAIRSGEVGFSVGDYVTYCAETAAYSEPAFPSGYDEAFYLASKGFACKLYPEQIEKIGVDSSLPTKLAFARERVQSVLERMLPKEESGILKAMLTGEKEDIPEAVYDLYVRAGVAHILCISGLHMSTLALYVSLVLEKLLHCTRRVSAAGTILVCIGFLFFSGITPSACRAVLMIMLLMLGRIFFQLTDRLNNIAVAAMVLLLLEPLYLFHAGFQLSFVTVTGICIAAERLEKRKEAERKAKKGNRKKSFVSSLAESIWETGYLSFYASLVSLPVVAYHFHSISLIGVLANLVVLPFSGSLLGFGMLSGLLGVVWLPLGAFLAKGAYWILQLYWLTCTILTEIPFASIVVGMPSATTLLLSYGLLLFLLLYGKRKGVWAGTAMLCCGLCLSVFGNRFLFHKNTIAFLNVGQGDAAVVSTYDGKTYLMDGGGQYGKAIGNNTGSRVVVPYLQSLGVRTLEGAFLSHPDSDHSTGILETVAEIPTKAIYLSAYPFAETEALALLEATAERYEIPLYRIQAGERIAEWECLYPPKGVTVEEDNQGSAVLRYTYGGTTVLFSGDIGEEAEGILLANGVDVSTDFLKAAHHGSKNSSGKAFLQAARPKAAVISCGKNNRYGHPHEETIARFLEAGTEAIYRTDLQNTIFLTLSPKGEWELTALGEQKTVWERWSRLQRKEWNGKL